MKLWQDAAIAQVIAESSALRFESMMSTWIGLFLFCLSVSDEEQFFLCSSDDTNAKPVLFPGLKFYRRKDSRLTKVNIQVSKPKAVTPISIEKIPFQIFKKKRTDANHTAPKNKPSDIRVFTCTAGEVAVDLMIWLGNKLVVVQCRLYNCAMLTKKLKKDLENLTKHFRERLWTADTDKMKTEVPCVAAELGLPRIEEDDVVFVLLSPNGLAKPQTDDGGLDICTSIC